MHQPSRQLRRLGALFLSLIACAIVAPTASAAEGDPYLDSCYTLAAAGECTVDQLVRNPFTMETSANGKHHYVGVTGDGSTTGHGIIMFDREADGSLVRRAGTQGCITANGSPSTSGDNTTRRCQVGANLAPLNGLHRVGNTLYATVISGNAILIFDIDPTTGVLTQKNGIAGCIHNGAAGGGCDGATGLVAPGAMANNASGDELYVRTSYGLAVFNRLADGTLSQEPGAAGCWHEDGAAPCSNGAGLGSGYTSRQITVVGDNLYVPFSDHRDTECYDFGWGCINLPEFNGGVGVFSINGDGTLSQPGNEDRCISNNRESGIGDDLECRPNVSNDLTVASAVTARGSDVYLSAGEGLYHFRRGPGGVLTNQDGVANGQHASCVRTAAAYGCAIASGIARASSLELAPDGAELVVAGEVTPALGFLLRNGGNGTLASRPGTKDCLSRDGSGGACEVLNVLSNPGTVRFSPDGLSLYATGHNISAVVTLDRDMAPVCQSPSIDVPFNNSVVVPFGCSDANGDAITVEVTQQPTNGSLAGIDQGAGTVRYSPSLGYTGADSFDFRAVTRGGAVTSGTNKVSLNVQPSPTPPVTDADGDGIQPPVDCDDSNPNIKPTTSEIPDNDVDENCDGIKARTPVARIRAGVDYFFDARNRRFTKVGRLNVTNIVAGATLRVTCKTRKKGCKFGTKKRKFSKATAKFNAKRYFNFTKKVRKKKRKIVSKLKAGARIEVRVTAPAMIGQVVTFKTRKGKTPSFTVKCLPVGATKPTKC